MGLKCHFKVHNIFFLILVSAQYLLVKTLGFDSKITDCRLVFSRVIHACITFFIISSSCHETWWLQANCDFFSFPSKKVNWVLQRLLCEKYIFIKYLYFLTPLLKRTDKTPYLSAQEIADILRWLHWAKGSITCFTTAGSRPEIKLDPDFNYTHPSEASQSVHVGSTPQFIAMLIEESSCCTSFTPSLVILLSNSQSGQRRFGRASFPHSAMAWAAQICLWGRKRQRSEFAPENYYSDNSEIKETIAGTKMGFEGGNFHVCPYGRIS